MTTESDFLRTFLQTARHLGWVAAHFGPAQVQGRWVTPVQGEAKGWPDVTLVRNGRLVFAELKRPGVRKVSPEQARWLDLLRAVPCAEVYVWNPADWDEIETVLK